MNALNAVLATTSNNTPTNNHHHLRNPPTTNMSTNCIAGASGSGCGVVGVPVTSSAVRSNGLNHHNSVDGYTKLLQSSGGQGSSSSCSASSSSSESEDHHQQQKHSTKLTFPRDSGSLWSQENVSPCSSDADTNLSDLAAEKTDSNGFSSTSSLDLSNPNLEVGGQYSSEDFLCSLENDLDCILENRDLNPFYDDDNRMGVKDLEERMAVGSGQEGASDCEFNVEDYLVDLDQYLEEQEGISVVAKSEISDQISADRRVLRKPNTNRTLPRNLHRDEVRVQKAALSRGTAARSSVHLGKESTDGQTTSTTSSRNPRRSLWLRNSMRKTKLIPLPNQSDGQVPSRSRNESVNSRQGEEEDDDGEEGTYLVAQLNPPSAPISHSVQSSTVEGQGISSSQSPPPPTPPPPATMEDFISFNRITFNPSVQQNVNQIHEERLRNSESSPGPHPPNQSQIVREVPIVRTEQEFQFHEAPHPPTAPSFDQLVPSSPPAPVTTTIPRQLGRRSDQSPRIIAINAESNTITVGTGGSSSRPTSAPSRVGLVRASAPEEDVRRSMRERNHNHQQRRGTEFDSMSSVASSRNPSPVSLESSSGSSLASGHNGSPERTITTVTGTVTGNGGAGAEHDNGSARRSPRSSTSTVTVSSRSTEFTPEDPEMRSKLWPHDLGSAMAIISCTLGVFNMSRFAVFSVHFGANFIVQFLILSVIFGIPMLWLQMCLGAKIQRGPAAMWKISPISRGIGIVLLLVQGLIGLYSAISISWLLVYFRDAFVSNTDRYKWQETVDMYRQGGTNETVTLAQTVPDYFNGIVLQRYNLGHAGRIGYNTLGKVRFQLAFNLSLFWTVVFIILCRGLRSYGKFVFPMVILPVIGLTAFTTKLLMMIDLGSVETLFPATDWDDFFVNSHSWMTAAQETFLTWGLFGASVLSMSSQSMKKKLSLESLRRDAFFVVLITLYGLLLAAVIGNVCVQMIKDNGYLYYPGSFETLSSNVFLHPVSQPIPTNVISVPPKWLPRFATVLGEAMKQPGIPYHKESGYQVLRLITELIPSAFGAAGQDQISSWWCFLGITSLAVLALAQFCAIWKPISTILGSNPSSVLLSCVTGLLLGIPLSTEMGIQIVYFLEVTIGGAWWVLIIWFGQIIALFLIRGRPYTGDLIIKDMKFGNTLSTFIALSWNIIIPIGLMFLCVFQYQVSDMSKFLHWRGVSYWPIWARKLGGIIQISILQIVPVTAVLQIYRFLSKGPPDILDRVTLLYRPDIEARNQQIEEERRRIQENVAAISPSHTIPLEVPITPVIPDDVPPKYTPPPSYTTATGARIAKMLRQSIRRSVRRIMGEPGNSRGHLSNLSDRLSGLNSGIGSRNFEDSCSSTTNVMGPPSYASVNIDLSLNTLTSLVPPVTSTTAPQSVYTMTNSSHHQIPMGNDKNLRPATSPTTPTNNNCVPNFLRPQRYLHSNRSLSLSGCVDQLVGPARNSFRGNNSSTANFFNRIVDPPQSRSLENLVLNSAAIGESSAIATIEDHSQDNASGVLTLGRVTVEVVGGQEDEQERRRGRSSSSERNKSRNNSTSSVI